MYSDEIADWRIIPARLRHWVAEKPDAPFLRCGGEWLSFAEVDRRTDRIAAGLAELGLVKGDRIGVILPNSEAMLLTFFACSKIGVIQVPMNTFLRGAFLSFQLRDAETRVVVADPAGVSEIQAVAAELPALELIVQVGGEIRDGSVPVQPFSLLEESTGVTPQVELTMRDINTILYTSGTTGLPKGCMLSHGYFMATPRAWFDNDWARADDVIFTAFPLFHSSGQQIALMIALQGGLPICFEAAFSASAFIANAKSIGATVVYGVGPMAMAILASPAQDDERDHSIRLAVFPPMAPAMQLAFEERFGTSVISEGYGQTECNPITMNDATDAARVRGSLGKPVRFLDVELFDDGDRRVPDGVLGEIVVRPREPEVMFQGYWGRPDATVQALTTLWHHTGDYGIRQPDGSIVFRDRKKDSMRRRGENVSSIELEAAIVAHPMVMAVAVHAVPSDLGEDDIKACIVAADPAQPPTPDELFEFFKEKIPYFAVPRYVEIVPALPVNAMGRVLKHELRAKGIGDAIDFEALGLTIDKSERRGRN